MLRTNQFIIQWDYTQPCNAFLYYQLHHPACAPLSNPTNILYLLHNSTRFTLTVHSFSLHQILYKIVPYILFSLVDKSDEQRKKSLVKYLEGSRERFIRLLVLVKWAHYLPNLTNAAVRTLTKEISI
jgi:hypothetical protein